MVPNMNEETGIHFGVINANVLNPEALDQILLHGQSVYEREFAEEMNTIRGTLARFLTKADVNAVMSEISTAFNENVSDDDTPVYFEDVEGVSGEYDRNNNILMIFKSPVLLTCRPCSPCYKNAGDLESPDEYGFDTYAPPADWWCEYCDECAEIVKLLRPVDTGIFAGVPQRDLTEEEQKAFDSIFPERDEV